jgi:hypothetical protein
VILNVKYLIGTLLIVLGGNDEPKLIGSRFRVQRLQPIEAAHYIDQDPEYRQTPLGETAL